MRFIYHSSLIYCRPRGWAFKLVEAGSLRSRTSWSSVDTGLSLAIMHHCECHSDNGKISFVTMIKLWAQATLNASQSCPTMYQQLAVSVLAEKYALGIIFASPSRNLVFKNSRIVSFVWVHTHLTTHSQLPRISLIIFKYGFMRGLKQLFHTGTEGKASATSNNQLILL